MSVQIDILKAVGVPELLAGLAEECAELSHAALKYRRALTQCSPTPVDEDYAYQRLLEEIADVRLYCSILPVNTGEIVNIETEKLKRWMRRLELKDES